jgi:hypothetical protein
VRESRGRPIARTSARAAFGEGRFKCQALLDEAAILACSVYVDLNPIRAGVATTPETSRFTSAYERIHANRDQLDVDATAANRKTIAAEPPKPAGKAIAKAAGAGDAWLSPIELATGQTSSVAAEPPGRGASNLGFLPVSLPEYLKLLDWTGRQIRRDKRGAIPADLDPILKRLHVVGEQWVDQVQHFGRWFRRAVGRATTLADAAAQRGHRWLHGIARSRQAFA